MEADIAAGKFIEHGEYKGHLYGTSGESVKSIVNAGCVCVLSPHYQAIKALRTVQTKPFIIHIKPPEFDVLKKSRTDSRAKSTFDESNARGFTVSITEKSGRLNIRWKQARVFIKSNYIVVQLITEWLISYIVPKEM